LLAVPEGLVVSYQDVAAWLGNPQASRAVARALATNPIAYLIPCHRVIAKDGHLSGYRWQPERKQVILGWEAATSATP
jgi:AraC family transcriptional regulator of adaptative response/methylated-DNA-[protein]-cysteine methyltransferase